MEKLFSQEEWYVYALFSKNHRRIYVGMSSVPDERLRQHNTGQVKSTKGYIPWERFYIEKVGARLKAREREKELKRTSGKRFLRSLLEEFQKV